MRLIDGKGDLVNNIKGSPNNWRLDASEETQLVELNDGGIPEGEVMTGAPSGQRAEEKRSMYLGRQYFEWHGFTDGCPWCRDIAIGRSGPSSGWAPHTGACRRRLEKAIQESDPARWQKHVRRRDDPPEAEAEAPRSPWADAEDDLLRVSHGEGECSCSSPSALQEHESEPGAWIQRLCTVDVCEVFSPQRVGSEAKKCCLKVGDAMDLTTGWDFNIAEHRRQAEEYVDRVKPLVLIGSPPCVAFSQLQTFVKEGGRKAQQLA
ncbi:hypothetical protein N9L68_01590 [bacterium]|nr:hypothetical protein [bacterium]